MAKDKKEKGNAESGTVMTKTSNLWSPLSGLWGFIEKNFSKMPRPVQVSVYVVIVIYFLLASIRLVAPEAWDALWNSDVEIQGVLTKPNWGGVEDTTGTHFLSGTQLYVTKDHPNPNSPRYYFRWILKADRQKLDDPVFFSVMEGTLEKGIFRITPRELIDHTTNGYVRMEFRDIPLTGMVRIGFFEETPVVTTASLVPAVWEAPFPQYQKSYKSKNPVNPDSVGIFLQRLLLPEFASSELTIRNILVGGGIPAMKVVADSVRTAVFDGRTSAAAMYALALSDYPSLYLFSTSESYSKVFEDPFYQKASRLLYEGNKKEGLYMATLLHNLQDARSLKYVFDAYDKATSDPSKGLCIYIVSSFVTNSSTGLKSDLSAKLKSLMERTTSKDLRTALGETEMKFEKSVKAEEK